MKRLYGIRGAITCENTKDSISEKTLEMCSLIFSEKSAASGPTTSDFVPRLPKNAAIFSSISTLPDNQT